MCAWVRVRGFHTMIPTVWMQLIIATAHRLTGRKISCFLPCQPRFSVCSRCMVSAGAIVHIYLFRLTLSPQSPMKSPTRRETSRNKAQRVSNSSGVRMFLTGYHRTTCCWTRRVVFEERRISLWHHVGPAANDKPLPCSVCSYMGILSVFFCFHRQHRQPRAVSAFFMASHTSQYVECSLYIAF